MESGSQCQHELMCYSPRRFCETARGGLDRNTMRATTIAVSRSLAAGLLAFCAVLPVTADNSDAAVVVENLHAALLDIMQNADALGYVGRRDRIAPLIEESFDLQFITQFSLGRYWSELSAEQRNAIVAVFSRLTIANYASRFNGYSGEQFETISGEQAGKDKELVRTKLKVNNFQADKVTLDYLLRKSDGKWRIVNVIANGVSDLSLKRADYGAVVKTQGFDALIAKLNGQIGNLESKN
jgi:phospholipid transport system substrate-binding protein